MVEGADDPYHALAPIFDQWAGWFAEATLARIEPVLSAHGAASFLDFACGTGGLLCELRRAHGDWRLGGTDASAAMLATAARKPEAATISWRHAAMTESTPGGPWGVAGCFFDALNHLPDVEALGHAFATAAAAIQPGGIYLFDVNNFDGFRSWWNGEREFSGVGWRLRTVTSFDGAVTARGRTIVLRDGRRSESEVVERYFAPEEIAANLAAAGFAVTAAEPWAPLPGAGAGKTFYACRRT